ncbi:MAG: SURF1 family protein [Gemmatimonadota bacterium]|jgi:surfeit locus 1 family protein
MTSTPSKRTLSVTPGGIAGTILAFAVAAVCIRLGVWQLHRRLERAAQNDRLEARLTLPTIRLPDAPRDTTGLLFRRVEVVGHFDDARSIVLPGRALRGTPGVHVVTPLRLDDGSVVLVNRGWLPSPDAAHVDLAPFSDTARISIEGLALEVPGAGTPAGMENRGDVAAADTFRRVWYVPDEATLRAQFPYALGAIMVQALPAPDAPRFPERLEPPPLDPGPHFGYAIQWFSFAAIAIAGWILVVLKSRAGDTIAPP